MFDGVTPLYSIELCYRHYTSCMRSTQCEVYFVYQLSISSTTEESLGKSRSRWPVAEISLLILTSSQQSRVQTRES
jgi:hypothetical protein